MRMKYKYNMESDDKGYKCECGKYIPYFHGDCFLYYDTPRVCTCGKTMILIDKKSGTPLI